MSLLGLLVGTKPTQQAQLNTVIAKQILTVMSSSKYQGSAAITQTANIIASGTSKITNTSVDQSANINTAVFLNDATTTELKSDLSESLKNTISNEASNMPFGQQQNVNTMISNVVDKSIEQNFTHDQMVALNSAATQTANVVGLQAGQISGVTVNQTASVVTQFAQSVANNISTQLVGTTDVANTSTMKTTNFISEIIGSIGSVFSGLMTAPLIAFVVIIAIIIIIALIFKMSGGSFSGLAGSAIAMTPQARALAAAQARAAKKVPVAIPVIGPPVEGAIDVSTLPPVGAM